MKKSGLIFFICLLVLFSCEKRLFDYRNKYCGDFQFHSTYSFTVSGSTTYDTTDFAGTIYYERKTDEKTWLHLHYAEENSLTVWISKDGTVSKINDGMYFISGQFFDKDSLSVNYSYTLSPAAGGSVKIDGVRID